MAKTRPQAKTEIGVVTSTKMAKTITVSLERLVKHPKYGKYLRRRTKLAAHDEQETAKVGDHVEVAFTRPLSKNKRWRFVKVVRPATASENVAATATDETAQEG